MSIVAIAQSALAAIEDGRADRFASCLTGDAVCVGLAPHVMDKAECVKVYGALVTGMPNWLFNPRNWEVEDDRVSVDIQIRAVHNKVLPPVLPSAPPVLATGRHILLPPEHMDFDFDGDRIARIAVSRVEGGGLLGVLKQLGIDLHHAA